MSDDHHKKRTPESIKESIDEVVHQLEQAPDSSESWKEAIRTNPEKWDELKKQIQKRQRELKNLVSEKKAGLIGPEEFDRRYRKIQDELTELEFELYNLRLGTDIKI